MQNGTKKSAKFCHGQKQESESSAFFPCKLPQTQAPFLYTYYAIVSLTVVILAASLIWIPFVQMIAELNTIISRILIYANRELLGDTDFCGLNRLGGFFGSQRGLILISTICLSYLVYLASADFLMFAGCYIYTLPDIKCLQQVKKLALAIIVYLLILTGNKGKGLNERSRKSQTHIPASIHIGHTHGVTT